MENNFLNLTETEKDSPIYRIISIERLFELFNTKKNTLVNPVKWDDPFENFMMNATGELDGGELFSISFRDNFYGQCWTKTRESDAMWRIYSPDKKGARIKTTPRKLLKSLYDVSDEYRDKSCFVGKVKYFTKPKLKLLLDNYGENWILDNTGIGQARTLLFKRNAFKHENEVRIIFNSQGEYSTDDIHSYTIDPFDLIDEIVFDPRILYKEFKGFKKTLKQMGFKNRILKSKLYHAPDFRFRLNN